MDWIRDGPGCRGNMSVIWRGLLELLPSMISELVWLVGVGSLVRVGIDNFVGGDESYKISSRLIETLHSKGYYTLNHVCSSSQELDNYWMNAEYLRLEGPLAREWMGYTLTLSRLGIGVSEQPDALMWKWNKIDGVVITRSAFDRLFILRFSDLSP